MKRLYVLVSILLVVLAAGVLLFYVNTKKDGELDYFQCLQVINETLEPDLYLEIGTFEGDSINLTLPETHAIGVDPEPKKTDKLHKNVTLYKMTSDEFFADKKIMEKEFKNKKADLVFIDGMHLFEYVLRDFINAEKLVRPDSYIILHDTLVISKETAQREPDKYLWTGDVYKMLPILKKYRPELDVKIIGTGPSGLCIITNLNSDSDVLEENYDKIVKEYMDYPFENIYGFYKQSARIYAPYTETVKKIIKK